MANLTFGIEIECLLICPRSDCDKIAEQGRCEGISEFAPQFIVHDALSKPFIAPCHKIDCSQYHTYTLPMLPEANAEIPGVYDTWQASTDFSVRLDHGDEINHNKYIVGQIEIKSRILNAAKPTPCCASHEMDPCSSGPIEWPWEWEVAQVLNILHAEFNNPKRPGYRLKVNQTTGLHVHVGGVEKYLWPKVARGVAGIFTSSERQLDTLLPDYRIGWYEEGLHDAEKPELACMVEYDEETDPIDLKRSRYCKPLSDTHIHNTTDPRILRTGPENGRLIYTTESKDPILCAAIKERHIPAWLYCIYSARNVDELQQWMHERMSTVNLNNLVDDPIRFQAKQTIEFRGHPGSLDFAEISAWVDLTVSTVRWAQETETQQAVQFMLREWYDGTDRMISMAYTVGASVETQDHYCRRYPMPQTLGNAVQRFEAAMELENAYDTTKDDLGTLCRSIETKRMQSCLKPAIAKKIQRKFESGFYGKFPQFMLNRWVRRKYGMFGDDTLMQEKGREVAFNHHDSAPDLYNFHEINPVAGWRRALLVLAREREIEAQPGRSRRLAASSSSSSSSTSSSSTTTSCCGMLISVDPTRRVSLVFENLF